MHTAVDLNASFVVHAGSCVWRLLSFFVAMRRREVEGVRGPRLLSCGCDAPRVTALSWAPCPIEGGMVGNFGAASWMDEGLLARVAGVLGARSVCVVWWLRGFCHFPLAAGMSWGRWWWMSSPPAWWVAAGVVCLPCVDAVSWCVSCAAGPAALSSCCLLSLAVSAVLRPSPPVAFFLFCLTDQLTGSSDSTTGDDDCYDDGEAPCWSLRCCAAARSCA
ncbi:hypothetical protein BCY84_13791 [Trypanosoma cruzi cruzi]|nr:hypothetical protein BCY84_13791 [Trypanosoma cruzi cruzi]